MAKHPKSHSKNNRISFKKWSNDSGSCENHRAPVVVSQLWYKVGSVDELPGKTGLSSCSGNMMFEGSEHYPGHRFIQIATSIGAKFNAETAEDYTNYYVETTPENLPTIFAMDADRMAHLNINPEAFAKQMEVVKEERRMRIENNPSGSTRRTFSKCSLTWKSRSKSIDWLDERSRTFYRSRCTKMA